MGSEMCIRDSNKGKERSKLAIHLSSIAQGLVVREVVPLLYTTRESGFNLQLELERE